MKKRHILAVKGCEFQMKMKSVKAVLIFLLLFLHGPSEFPDLLAQTEIFPMSIHQRICTVEFKFSRFGVQIPVIGLYIHHFGQKQIM